MKLEIMCDVIKEWQTAFLYTTKQTAKQNESVIQCASSLWVKLAQFVVMGHIERSSRLFPQGSI